MERKISQRDQEREWWLVIGGEEGEWAGVYFFWLCSWLGKQPRLFQLLCTYCAACSFLCLLSFVFEELLWLGLHNNGILLFPVLRTPYLVLGLLPQAVACYFRPSIRESKKKKFHHTCWWHAMRSFFGVISCTLGD